MSAWTPPTSTGLSSHDIDHILAGLRDTASRDDALAFLDTVTDPGLLHVVACGVARGRHDRPMVGASAAGLRNYIRNRI